MLDGTLSFLELRNKEVVNVLDGRRLGRILDVVFSGCKKGYIEGIVVPFIRRFFFFRDKEVFVPWHCVRKIGEDVILIELVIEGEGFTPPRRRGRYGGHGMHGGGPCIKAHGEGESGQGKDDKVRVHSAKSSGSSERELEDEYAEYYDEGDYESGSGGKSLKDEQYSKPKFDINKKPPPPKQKPRKKEKPPCDGKCEKCMLFDCSNRWKDDR